ncbi:MAG: hypothetical protein ACC613_05180 [Synergistales bacterium]
MVSHFFIPLISTAFLFAIAYVRLLMPAVRAAGEAFGLEGESSRTRFGKAIQLLFVVAETYIQGGWSAYCATVTILAMHNYSAGHRWVFYLFAFVLCEGVLGYIARREPAERFLLTLRSVLPMGAFVVFIMRPPFLLSLYGWLAHVVSKGAL